MVAYSPTLIAFSGISWCHDALTSLSTSPLTSLSGKEKRATRRVDCTRPGRNIPSNAFFHRIRENKQLFDF